MDTVSKPLCASLSTTCTTLKLHYFFHYPGINMSDTICMSSQNANWTRAAFIQYTAIPNLPRKNKMFTAIFYSNNNHEAPRLKKFVKLKWHERYKQVLWTQQDAKIKWLTQCVDNQHEGGRETNSTITERDVPVDPCNGYHWQLIQ